MLFRYIKRIHNISAAVLRRLFESKQRRSHASLHGLSDHVLRDIGLRREAHGYIGLSSTELGHPAERSKRSFVQPGIGVKLPMGP